MNGKNKWGAGTLAGLSVLLVAASGAWAAKRGATAGIIIDVQGDVVVCESQKKKGSKKRCKSRSVNKFVYEGDVIKTGEGGMMAVAFIGGSEVRINENSEFEVRSGGNANKPTEVFTKIGQAWSRMIHKLSNLHVRTPVAVAAVRGTEADVSINDAARMTVKVYEGHVDLQNKKGTTALRAGQVANVGGFGQAPSPARTLKAGDRGTWQSDLNPKDLVRKLRKLDKEARLKRKIKLRFKKPNGQYMELELDTK